MKRINSIQEKSEEEKRRTNEWVKKVKRNLKTKKEKLDDDMEVVSQEYYEKQLTKVLYLVSQYQSDFESNDGKIEIKYLKDKVIGKIANDDDFGVYFKFVHTLKGLELICYFYETYPGLAAKLKDEVVVPSKIKEVSCNVSGIKIKNMVVSDDTYDTYSDYSDLSVSDKFLKDVYIDIIQYLPNQLELNKINRLKRK